MHFLSTAQGSSEPPSSPRVATVQLAERSSSYENRIDCGDQSAAWRLSQGQRNRTDNRHTKTKPVAVTVGVQNGEDIEQLLMAYSPELQAIVAESPRQIREGEVLSDGGFGRPLQCPEHRRDA